MWVQERLLARGEMFERLNGFRHVAYEGSYVAKDRRAMRKRQLENGRVIVDPHAFDRHATGGPALMPFEAEDSGPEDEIFVGVHNMMCKATSHAYERYQSALAKYLRRRKRNSASTNALSLKQLLLSIPTVRGYDLAFKTWGEFSISNVRTISWNPSAFQNLVLPHGYKEIIRAFVTEQLSRTDGFDDIVYGKGRGFIMLLSGEPGVGKTLTAESVAEEMHQPLYALSASELGETAIEVEEALEMVLELASKWNAILLLDECDMFLEARNMEDLKRNRLVSVFLRKLEYYTGVMFLTSNRVNTFDPAFESRIHLTIHYPPLDAASRLQIWKTFARMRAPTEELGGGERQSALIDKQLGALAKIELNGRQIKNIVKTARLLSRQDNVPLDVGHVELVLKVRQNAIL